jgi:hypothetical protein
MGRAKRRAETVEADVVVCKRLELRDATGTARIVAEVARDGVAGLVLKCSGGKGGIHLLAGEFPAVMLYDRENQPRVMVLLTLNGEGAVTLLGRDGKAGATLWQPPEISGESRVPPVWTGLRREGRA